LATSVPVTEEVAARLLTLPNGAGMTVCDAQDVLRKFKVLVEER
jgi:dTDP-4-amino-4,6-dideoxygalactose transaminase